MSIAEFGAVAGNIAGGLQDYWDQRALGNAQRAAAQTQQMALARQERLRQLSLQDDLVASPPSLDIGAAPSMVPVAGVTPPPTPTPTPPPTGGASTGVKPPATTAARPAAKAAVLPAKAGLETGVGGFRAYTPEDSDFRRARIAEANTGRLNDILSGIANKTDVAGLWLQKPFASQSDKAKLVAREAASDWYSSAAAKKYFRDYPQALEIAQKNPVGFYQSLQQKNRERDAAAKTKAAAPKAAAPKAVLPATAAAAGTDLKQYANMPWEQVRQMVAADESVSYDTLAYDRGNRNLANVRAPQPITTMTIGQVLDFQRNQMRPLTRGQRGKGDVGSTGVGRYQFESDTLEENAKKAFGKDYKNVQFTPETQEAVAETLWDTVKGDPARLTKTWAAFSKAQQPAAGAAPQGAGVQQTQAQARQLAASDFFKADPAAISQAVSQAVQDRQELVRMADLYRRSGMGAEYNQARLLVMQADRGILNLQGAQGVQELIRYRDPRRIAAVYSMMDGGQNKIEFAPRSDGTFNMTANGAVIQEGLTSQQIVNDYMMAADPAYRQAEIENRRGMNTKMFESQLKIGEKQAEIVAQAMKDLAVAQTNAAAQITVKKLEMAGFQVSKAGEGGGLLINRKDGVGGSVYFNPEQGVPGREDIPPAPMMTRVGGAVVPVGSGG